MKPLSLTFVLLLSLFSMCAFSQNQVKTYDAQWKIVDAQVLKALPQSALQEVKKIYQLAKKEKQEAQVIKATLYMIDLQNENREDTEIASIQELEKEVSESAEPAKSILNNLLATVYYRYYQSRRWQLYKRTQTSNFKKEDIATWGTEDFHQKIGALYLASLENESLLKQTRLEPFDAIITKGNMRKLRPTLLDLLAFKALEYFSSDEQNLKNPAISFEINAASAFDPAVDFIYRKFETKDTASLEYKALMIYQKLIAFHINDKEPDALIDADINRLEFVRTKSVHPDTDQLYFMAIHHVADQYQNTPAAAQAWYLEAQWHNERGAKFDMQGDTTHRFEKVRAAKICAEIIKANPDSEGGINAQNLLKEIKQKRLQFWMENVAVPGKPFLIKLEYANTSKISLRIIPASEKLKTMLEGDDGDENWRTILQTKPLKAWEQELPDAKDHQLHHVEIKADAIPAGEYYLLASTGTFNLAESRIGRRLFYVSNISWVQRDSSYFVLDRDSGQPLSGARATIWQDIYNEKTRTNKKQKGPVLITDRNGYFKWKSDPDDDWNTDITFEITHAKDRLFLTEPLPTLYNEEEDDDDAPQDIYLFTDRSIYRPGQTLYYKGIARKGPHILKDPNQNIETILYDANDQAVGKATHKVNTYGSFSGFFRLPNGLLNGQFRIRSGKTTSVYFRVEDYKRPKFSIEFDTLRGSYKLEDTVRVTGTTVAYAGNIIDGAKVSYRVERQARFVYAWRFKNRQTPWSNSSEIAHGETVTDTSGRFTIKFNAIPDHGIDKKLDPVFDYVVYADITDGNGETSSGETKISIGYKSILLTTSLTDRAQIDSLTMLRVRTENMNRAFVPAEVSIQISGLTPEKRLIKPRFWPRPDLFVMSKNEFVKHFPHDEYDNESEWESWPVLKPVVDKKISSSADGKIDLSGFKFLPGFYKIEVSALDSSNGIVKDIKYFELSNREAPAGAGYLQVLGDNKSIELEQKATLHIGTSAQDVFVISSTNRGSDKNPLSFFQLDTHHRAFEFVAQEADRGGFSVDYLFVKHNRVYQESKRIHIPWSNKDLKIEYLTFRNKAQPGGTETWKVKVTGYKDKNVATELLASMYDASLDQFFKHQWKKPEVWPSKTWLKKWGSSTNFELVNSEIIYSRYGRLKTFVKRYDELMSDNIYEGVMVRGGRQEIKQMSAAAALQGKVSGVSGDPNTNEIVLAGKFLAPEVKKDEEVGDKSPSLPTNNAPQIRKNFNETAFFFSDLQSNEKGEIEFSFTMPEALTRWKFQALAHTKDLAFGYSSKEIVTQKDLMVQPNAPRFLREGDKIGFISKIANLTDKELNGTATLRLFDTGSNEPADQLFKNVAQTVPFTVAAKQSTAVKFPIEVPKNFARTLTWRIVATSGAVSDGEENILPVLPNRMLVTETLPLTMSGAGSKSFRFEKLINSGKSATLTNQSLTIEYTGNPVWLAIQALPYLMEYPYDCAEQTWNRYYANALASSIAKSSPRIARIFENWRTADTTALLSNLQKNQELKSILLEETPWVLAAKSEAEQKRNVALLFDLVRMGNEMTANLEKVKKLQTSNGGFAWFKGGPDDRYMTQYIVSGIGHLQKLNAIRPEQSNALKVILDRAIPYLDRLAKDDYDRLVKSETNLREHTPSVLIIQYLYMRSFFPAVKIGSSSQKAFVYFSDRIKKSWNSQNKYLQGMIAIISHRSGDSPTAGLILKSLRETSIRHEELGMYWKSAENGYWHENPIERQALLIEAFQEAGNDTKTVDDLRTWLLKNKQSNRWESTKATAEACYALLLQGTDWLSSYPEMTIRLGQKEVRSTEEKQESGTGYFQKQIPAQEISPDMGNIQVKVASAENGKTSVSWGAVYWQYFEDLDKITTAETPLKLERELFVERNSDRGPVLTPVRGGDLLKIGDKIKVRIVLRVDREMEYVHMKDMRASALEPVQVLSGYKWQDGLGYYESTRDASTNFFFSNLRKGTYVFEYPLFITHAGDFSNGITSIQCMYAPEFTAHSEGVRISVSAR